MRICFFFWMIDVVVCFQNNMSTILQHQQEKTAHEYTQEKLTLTHKELEKLKDGEQTERLPPTHLPILVTRMNLNGGWIGSDYMWIINAMLLTYA